MARSQRPSERRGDTFRSAGVRVEIDETKLYIVARRDMSNELRKILRNIEKMAKGITANKRNFPFSKSKRMSASIRATAVKGVNQHAVSGSVQAGGPSAPYARFVHEGTKRHVIRARSSNPSGLLSFNGTNELTGQVVRVPAVDHPGGQAKPFLVVAARRVVSVPVRRR